MIVIPDRLALRRTRPDDLELLDRIDADADAELAERHGLEATSADDLTAARWAPDTADQYLFFRVPDLSPLGYASIYDADHRNGTAWLSLVAAAEHRRNGLALLGAAVVLTRTFRETPLRKVYAQTTDLHLEAFRSVIDDGTATVEVTFDGAGRRPDGSTYDLHWLSIERDAWSRSWGRLVSPHLSTRSEGSLLALSVDPARRSPR